MIFNLTRRLKRQPPPTGHSLADEPLHNPAWRRVVLAGMFCAALAFVLGLVLEAPGSPGGSFDRVAYSLCAVGIALLVVALLVYPSRLKEVTSALVTGAGAFFIAKAGYLLFFAPAGVDIPKELTETFFWVPILYVLAFLVPGLRLGRASAGVTSVLLLLLSAADALFHPGAPNIDALYAFVQLNLANLTTVFVTRTFSVYKDIALKAHAKSEVMARLAHTDALTGLPNRLHFEGALQGALKRARAREERCAVVFIDLDRFKSVNDTLGHEAGDRLLEGVAARLKEVVRAQDLLARMSGDEFVLLIEGVRDAEDAEGVVRKLRDTFETPFAICGQTVAISASLGFSLFPEDGGSADVLLKHADSAMYGVKAGGRDGVKRFSAEADAGVELRRRLERDLRGAAERGELELYYQPLFDLRTGRMSKCEALLRWRHPELGPVPPDTFIPVAEESGLMSELGTWVLHSACRQNAAWGRSGHRLPVAVNVSPLQFAQPDFFDAVRRALDAAGLSPGNLELELTESAVLSDTAHVSKTLARLQRLGVRVAIDDFGTGYSSLAYLRHLPIDTLKVDRTFVTDLGQPLGAPHFALALVQAIVSIAQTLDLEVVAEGVETAAQAELLGSLGVHVGQGYHFAKPMPASELQALLPHREAGVAGEGAHGKVVN